MRPLMPLAAISLAALASHPAAAEDIDESSVSRLLEQLRIDRVSGGVFGVVVRGSRTEGDRRATPDISITCLMEVNRGFLVVKDRVRQTEERAEVPNEFCKALLAAARSREEAQKRR